MLNPSWRTAIRRLAASLTHRPRRSVQLGRDCNLEQRLAPATVVAPVMPGLSAIDAALAGSVQRAWEVPVGTQTSEWVVGLSPLQDPASLASFGATLTPVDYWQHVYVAEFADAKDVAAFGPSLASEVAFAYPMIAVEMTPRFIPNDTLFPDQWHLRNTGQNGGAVGADAKLVSVWDNYTGNGVLIGIVDDGLEHSHPDLQPNYVAAHSYDFNNSDSDPDPGGQGDHGTAVAGVAAGKGNNNLGIAGAAFNAQLAGLRLISAGFTDATGANALTYHNDAIDIYSNSWGPVDNGTLGSIPPLTLAAIQNSYVNGRNGKGTIYTWAAGNGLGSDDNVNYDGYANSRFVIAVGAIDDKGKQASYSEPGAPMLVTAYSSSNSGQGITTTDLVGSNGATGGDYRDDFGGTSSATPLVSGVIALMLQANPSLTSRDVQNILVRTARKNDAGDVGWTTNAAGFHVNHKYGFGAIDAKAAVNLAKTWNKVPDLIPISSAVVSVNQSIPDNNATGITSSVSLPSNIRLEHVEVVFNSTHPSRGDLEVVLTAPSGTKSTLAAQHDTDTGDNHTNWVFSTVRNWGESSAGTWKLTVRDRSGGQTGTFTNWQIRAYGVNQPPGLANLEKTTLAYLENQSKFVTSTLTVLNTGSANLTGAKVSVSSGFVSGEDRLSFTANNDLTGGYDDNSGVLTITGTGTIAQYQAALRSVKYQNLSEQPQPQIKSVTFQITDANGNGSPGLSRNVSVTPVNDAPTFTAGPNISVDEDSGPQTFDGWATEILPGPPAEFAQDASMEIVSFTNASLFVFPPYISPTGTLQFTSAADASGSSTVKVRARDNGGTANGGVDFSAPQTFQIVVSPLNDPPVPQADQYIVMEDGTLTVAAPGVLANDRDMEGDSLTAVKLTNPTNGMITAFGSNGSFTYKPNGNFSGTDSFTYKANDGVFDSSPPTTVTIQVARVNDAPTAVDDNATSDGNPKTINVVGNDTDPDGDALRVSNYTRPNFGRVTRLGNALVYTPLAGSTSNDSFNYTISDGYGGSDVGTVFINNVTDVLAPEVTGAKLTYGSSTSAVIDLGSLSRSVLPWANINKFSFQFNEGVTVNAAALTLVGGTGGNVALTFSYNAATRTATWTTAAPLDIDRYTMQLDATLVTDNSNNPMAADWAKAFAVLPGDFDGNGVVDDVDLAGILDNYTKPGKPLNRFADITGNGIVDATDLDAARGNRSRRV